MWCLRQVVSGTVCGGVPQRIVYSVCVCAAVCSSCSGSPVCVCSSGGLAAEEPGQRSERRPMRSHPHAEEKATEHPELHAGSAQERPLETAGPAGKHQQHMDALTAVL